MAAIERTITINIRKEIHKVPAYKRAKKAITAIREHLMQHMKAKKENVKIGKYLNLKVWEHGMKNPPVRVKVTAIKDDEGMVHVYLFGAKRDVIKTEEKDEKKIREPIVVNPKEPKSFYH